MRFSLSEWGLIVSIASIAVIVCGILFDAALILLEVTPITHHCWRERRVAFVILLPFATAMAGMAIHLFVPDWKR